MQIKWIQINSRESCSFMESARKDWRILWRKQRLRSMFEPIHFLRTHCVSTDQISSQNIRSTFCTLQQMTKTNVDALQFGAIFLKQRGKVQQSHLNAVWIAENWAAPYLDKSVLVLTKLPLLIGILFKIDLVHKKLPNKTIWVLFSIFGQNLSKTCEMLRSYCIWWYILNRFNLWIEKVQ